MQRFSFLLIFMSALITSCSGNRKPVEKPYLEIILEAESGNDTIRQHEIIEILSARMDNYGVSQNDYSFDLDSGRIKARFSMDAVRDRAVLRKILMTDARLVFRETYSLSEIATRLIMADSLLKGPADTLANYESQKIGLLELLNTGSSGVSQYGEGYISQAPLVGMALLKDTSTIDKMLNDSAVRALFPRDIAFHWTQFPTPTDDEYLYGLIAVRTGKTSTLDPGKLQEVRITDMNGGGKCLQIEMTDAKAIEWGRLTKANIGRSIAIEIDDHVFSYPTVQGEITGGKSMISGPDVKELEELKIVMSAGSLPVRIHIVEERVVK